MPTKSVQVDTTLHGRIKQLALDTGKTIGQLVHQSLDDAVTAGEQAVKQLKKKVRTPK